MPWQAALARLDAHAPAPSGEEQNKLPSMSGGSPVNGYQDGQEKEASNRPIAGIGHDDKTTEVKEEEMMRLGTLDQVVDM
jgi:hypothetical protein